jgi:hypothetical protein
VVTEAHTRRRAPRRERGRSAAAHFARLLFCALAVHVSIVRAQAGQPVEDANLRAKQLFDQGVVALSSQNWLDAEELFRRSAEIVPRSSSLYNLALALFEQHRYRDCVEVCDRMLTGPDEQDVARFRESGARLREKALAAAAIYRLTVDPGDASVNLDGAPLADRQATRRLVLDPGLHRIAASAPGHATRELALDVASGEQSSGTLVLAPVVSAAPPAPSASSAVLARAPALHDAAEPETASAPVPALILIGVGGAALVGALVTGLLALDADDQFTSKCGGVTDCDEALKPLQERTERLALATDVLLASGAALAGVGLTLFLLQEPAADRSSRGAELAVRGIGARLHGAW